MDTGQLGSRRIDHIYRLVVHGRADRDSDAHLKLWIGRMRRITRPRV